ncbi:MULTISPECIES: AI-2E family transporter [Rhodococcus]|uniref:AI-2E family transporter n=2 Tax=Rhodococcus TaxID=1827 RepID=A0ABU4B493_9NOCA|nr:MULTISPECIES: AI-2E family transporter [Rhodococcus]KAA0924703.1 AI-2E family transporter [Rhodococcus sp. ANT_H53B]MDI9926092.1 AI-2E family transporter [Rhodococcus sp. IEGM 1341]MDV6233306.1 AI-2E family transporter [Rhodococcus cercidiphylli]MDV6304296.1 AI-2E family transporter [Rhodococcus cerastii]MDV7992030.1 AI-2E family transporter [Rhodococcus sp. IEGM 1374]
MHPLVRVGAEWTWRLLVLFAGFITFCLVVAKLSTVVIPLGLALLASAMLVPVVDWMHRRGVPRAVAVIVVIIASIGVVAGIMTFIVEQFIEGLPQVGDQFTQSINGIEEWLSNGPLHISEDQIRQATDSLVKVVQDNQEAVTSGALTTAAVIGEILTGALLTLFVLIFFLYGGDQIWQFVTRLAPTAARRRIRTAGIQGFGSLVGYVRATVAVAAADAIGIGAGLAILGVPLALPLASLVFIGAFIPIIGAVLTGFVAVFIALVTKGLITAVITLGIVVAVMQLEGHVLQPLLLGRAVRLHPLAVVLSITVGILLAGIVGGLLAVPIVAVLNTAVRSLLAADPDEVYEELEVPDPLYSAEPSDPHTPPGSDEPERLPKGELKTPNEKTDADG